MFRRYPSAVAFNLSAVMLLLKQLILETGIECVRSRDQRPYWFIETEKTICIKEDLNFQKTSSLLQHGGRSFVYFSNKADMTLG